MSDQAAVLGALVLICICVAMAVFATRMYRESNVLYSHAMSQPITEPFDVICGLRSGPWNVTTPFGRAQVTDDAVTLSSFGARTYVPWSDIESVGLVKPLNGIGWGVRIKASGSPDYIVWIMSRALADRLLDACELRRVRIDREPQRVI